MKDDIIGILGLGLMGGSLALGIKARGRKKRVIIGVDRDPERIREALDGGAVDRGYLDPEEGFKDVDVLFLAVPLEEAAALVPELSRILPAGTLVTDMASTKTGIVRAMEDLPAGLTFLGGHPMTGSERQGFRAADAFLFENAAYVLTPTGGTPGEAVETVEGLVRELGAEVILLSPKRHDQMVAAVSHLPHLLAGALVRTVSGEKDRDLAFSLAAGSFRDCTRVSLSSPRMWQRICLENKEALLPYLSLYRQQLEQAEDWIRRDRGAELLEFFSSARDLRDRLPPRGKGFLTPLFDAVVQVQDAPGVIGEMATLLGREGVNIAEIEVLRVREAEEGSIRFGFKEEEERARALRLLQGAGIKAWTRE